MRGVKVLILLLLATCISIAGNIPNLSFLDPYYMELYIGDTTISNDWDYLMMDSLGIDYTVGYWDTFSSDTSYSHGIKFLSVADTVWAGTYNITYGSRLSYVMMAEFELNNDSLEYSWERAGGVSYGEGDIGGWLLRSGIDTANSTLELSGRLFKALNELKAFWPIIRMKSWNYNNSDTLFMINITYYSHGSYSTKTIYVTGNDFDGSGVWTYKEFEDDYFLSTSNGYITTSFLWTGIDSVALDYFAITNQTGMAFFNKFKNNYGFYGDSAQEGFNYFLDSTGRDNKSHFYFWYSDDIAWVQYWPAYMYDRLSTISTGHRALSNNLPHPIAFNIMVQPNELMYYNYPIRLLHDSLTGSVQNAYSIQDAYNNYVTYLEGKADTLGELGVDFWFITQCGKIGNVQRNPTYLEQVALIYLPILYNVKCIGYFTYPTIYYDDTMYTPPGMKIPVHTSIDAMEQRGDEHIDVGGLVEWDRATHKYVPNYRWYAAKEANSFLDALWPTLENLEWVNADSWDSLGNISGCVIDSIYSTTFHADSTYLEVGRFTSAGGDDYYMFVNRRSLSSDSQDVEIYLHDEAFYEIYDVFNNTYDTITPFLEKVSFISSFKPAGCKLLRVTPLDSVLLAGNVEGVWPDSTKVNILGDVTVYVGDSLTIRDEAQVLIPSCSDSQNGGYDANKTEIRVWGKLRIEGTENNPVVLDPPGDTTGWYGIFNDGYGKIYLNNVEIKNAKYGIFDFQCDDMDSIINCTIDSCELYGIYSHNTDYLYVENCNIGYVENGYGIYLYGGDSNEVRLSAIISNNGLKLYSSEASLYGLTIESDSVYDNTVGIDFYGSSDAEMDSSEVYNYDIGVKIGSANNISIDRSSIHSNNVFGDKSTYGIDASSALTGNNIVRRSCFENIETYDVYSNGTTIDLGTWDDEGFNNFFATYYEFPKCRHDDPDKFVYNCNTSGDSTSALENYYETCRTDWPTFFTVVIWSNYFEQEAPCYFDVGSPKIINATQDSPILPDEFSVRQNYPNPFNPATVIEYSLPKASEVEIQIYNILGQKVRLLEDGHKSAGIHEITWDGNNDQGSPIASGIYLYRIKAGEFESTKKMIILK